MDNRSRVQSRHAFRANRFAHGFGGRGYRGGYGRYWGYGYGWGGSIFWPYAYGDIFSYALWPDDYYNDSFWGYGADGLYDGLFWGDSTPYYGGGYVRSRGRRSADADTSSSSGRTALCNGFAPGVTDLPIDRFQQAIQPDDSQRALLADLKTASAEAGKRLNQACPADTPLTPVARLDAIKARLAATDDAIKIIQTPLDRLYSSLNDQQRQRFDALGQSRRSSNNRSASNEGSVSTVCDQASASFTDIPVDRIQQSISPDDAQKRKLDRLKKAAADSASSLQGSCPQVLPTSPAARLGAAQKRIDALSQALDTVRPAVEDFYSSLSDEQKARFNATDQTRTKQAG